MELLHGRERGQAQAHGGAAMIDLTMFQSRQSLLRQVQELCAEIKKLETEHYVLIRELEHVQNHIQRLHAELSKRTLGEV
jgi:hypothetical protein